MKKYEDDVKEKVEKKLNERFANSSLEHAKILIKYIFFDAKHYVKILTDSCNEYFYSLLLDHIENFSNKISKFFPKADIQNSFFNHQLSHVVSSYISSEFDKALCITMYGQGDDTNFSSIYLVNENLSLEKIIENRSNIRNFKFDGFKVGCSIGRLYAYFRFFLGFTQNTDEGKVEALAAFGNLVTEIYSFLKDKIKVNCIKININEDTIQKKLPLLLEKYEKEKENLAATIQRFSEEVILEYVKNALKETGCDNICLSGWVFANVIINKRIFEEISENIHIVPAMGDHGNSEGACYLTIIEEGMIDEVKEINKNYNIHILEQVIQKKR